MHLVADSSRLPEPPKCESPCVWVHVVFDGGMGDRPDVLDSWPSHVGWFDYECDLDGLESLLNVEHAYEWMLQNGIAPGQEFVVRIDKPTYSRDYWGEYDIDYGDWEIVYQEPISENRAGRLWLAWFKDTNSDKIEICTF